MRHLLLIILLLPMAVMGQTKADYEHAMRKFVRFYNKGQGDSILLMFPENSRENLADIWSKKTIQRTHNNDGTIQAFAYLGIDEEDGGKVRVYKVMYSKYGPATFSFTLLSDGHFGTFRMITESDGIKKLLEKDEARRK